MRLHSTGRTELWMHEPAISYAMPNDGGVTVLATMPTKAELPSFRSDPEAALLAALRKLPDAPRFDPGGRVSKIIGAPDCPLITRTAVPANTVALIGDAALTSDPSQGVGCGWAFQSAEWLADEVAPALLDGRPVAAALRRYQRRRTALRRTPDDHRAGGESRTAHRHRPSDRAGGGPRSPRQRHTSSPTSTAESHPPASSFPQPWPAPHGSTPEAAHQACANAQQFKPTPTEEAAPQPRCRPSRRTAKHPELESRPASGPKKGQRSSRPRLAGRWARRAGSAQRLSAVLGRGRTF